MKNKFYTVLLSLGLALPLQHTFANDDLDAVDAMAAVEVASSQISPEQHQDAKQLREVVLLMDLNKIGVLGEIGEKTTLSQEDKNDIKAALDNMKQVNTQAKKLKMQTSVGRDAVKKFIAFNDYNIKHIENNSMFTGTDAVREKMRLTIGALNQDVMQALTNLFVE